MYLTGPNASLAGPSAHPTVTLRFEYPDAKSGLGAEPPGPLEVRAQFPIPAVGEAVVLRDDRGGASTFQVVGKRISYASDSRCSVTLMVAPEDPSN
jgi:hypothetical protein